MCPECIVLEAEPTGYPRAPVGKKRVWIDVRNQQFVAYITFDRRGEMWKSFEPGWSRYQDGKATVKDAKGNSDWSWLYVLSQDIQANCMRRIMHSDPTDQKSASCGKSGYARVDLGGRSIYK